MPPPRPPTPVLAKANPEIKYTLPVDEKTLAPGRLPTPEPAPGTVAVVPPATD
ncbi:MAG: hypothetical protein ISR39_10550 [Akkermansiaceae bacterium]|nr:hypothetical protein [Akkermansiaceae bacterium]